MKDRTKYLLIAAAFLLVLAAAYLAYDRLADDYAPAAPLPTDAADASGSADADGAAGTDAPTSAAPQAYDFTVYDGEGRAVRLSDFFGKPTVVNFWATWCGPCKSEMPSFESAYQTYGDRVSFVMVNLTDGAWETVEDVKEFLADAGYTFPVYYDTAQYAATAYSVYSIPATLFINADGTVYGSYLGALSSQNLNTIIRQLIGE